MSTDYRTRLEADAKTWNERRAAALAEAEQIIASARAEAEGIASAAEHEGERIRAERTREAEVEVERLQAELKLLIGRRQSVVEQLGELANLVGVSVADYTDAESGS